MIGPVAAVAAVAQLFLSFATLLAWFGGIILGGMMSDVSEYSSVRDMDIEFVVIGDHAYTVWLAETTEEKGLGLSGITQNDLTWEGIDGMLFVFDEPEELSFWMHKMELDLDFYWILEGEVVKIDDDIPAPVHNNGEVITITSEPFEADMVLELPADYSDWYEIEVGDRLTF